MNGDTGRNDFVLLDGVDLPQDDVSLTIDEFEELHIETKKLPEARPFRCSTYKTKRQSKFTKVQIATSISIYKRGLLYAHHTNESHHTEGTIFHIVYEQRCHLPFLNFYLFHDDHRLLHKLDRAIE
jgi:hypothetical protein